eukprot:scaffold288844_cov35-Tisochrysis_lutea.AAC.3
MLEPSHAIAQSTILSNVTFQVSRGGSLNVDSWVWTGRHDAGGMRNNVSIVFDARSLQSRSA